MTQKKQIARSKTLNLLLKVQWEENYDWVKVHAVMQWYKFYFLCGDAGRQL